jgi:predicted MFS family arabinose efflux permease
MVAAYACNFFSFAGQIAVLFYFPLHMQAVYGMSATRASLLLIPAAASGVSGSLFGGWWMKRTGKYYYLTITVYTTLFLGQIMVTMFSGVLYSSVLGMVLGMMVCAFSNGLGVTSSLIAIIANAKKEDQAVATACSYLFRSMGSVVGVALAATAVNTTLRETLALNLGGLANPKEIADMVRKSLDVIKTLDPDVQKIVRECYAKSTQVAFGTEALVVSGAAISAWFLKEVRLG